MAVWQEADNFALARTELDDVLDQYFAYESTTPGIATALTAALFHQVPNYDREAYIFEVFAGSGLWSKVGETQIVPSDTPKVRNKKIVEIEDYADSTQISKNLFDDDPNLHRQWAQQVRNFARMIRSTQDKRAFDTFRNSFTTELTADGVSAVNAAHPLIKGGTLSNLITGVLSDASLYDAIVALRTQKNQASVIMGGVPSALLVAPENWKNAMQITDSALVSDTANNALNVYRSQYGFQVYTSPWLSAVAGANPKAWWLMTENHTVTRVVRQGPQTALTPWDISNNRTYNYQGNFREVDFIGDYCGLVGSNPA